jgi:tripartite motif-containing protein 71
MAGIKRTTSWAAAMLCAPALALTVNVLSARAEGQFGSYGTGAGMFVEPNGIAVDQESGDVYVVDTNNERVERFTGQGRFVLAWGWGVRDGRSPQLQRCTAASGCHAGLRGAGAGQLGYAEGVAVDNDPVSGSQHDVYVVDISNARVQKFSPDGRFLLMFGGQVNQSARERGETTAEDVCPVKPGDRCAGGTAGSGDGQFEFRVEGDFVAVGPTGTVYVGDRNRVQEFDPDGRYRGQLRLVPAVAGEGELGGTFALALDPAGDVYAIRDGVSGVQEYSPRGALLRTLDAQGAPELADGPTPNLAVDAAGHVFLDYHEDEQHRIVELGPSGEALASFDNGMEDGLHGLAYSDPAGELYIVNSNNGVVPPRTRIRIVAPPRATAPVLWSFSFLSWLAGP